MQSYIRNNIRNWRITIYIFNYISTYASCSSFDKEEMSKSLCRGNTKYLRLILYLLFIKNDVNKPEYL